MKAWRHLTRKWGVNYQPQPCCLATAVDGLHLSHACHHVLKAQQELLVGCLPVLQQLLLFVGVAWGGLYWGKGSWGGCIPV